MTAKHTEASMIDLLHDRYGTRSQGIGRRYAAMSHVRSDAGFDAQRTADFMALDLWPSKGLILHGHEVKISRSDWLNELKDPEKSAAFMKHVDYWWLVIADKDMVKAGELPEGWGMMTVGGDGKLRVVKQAPRLNKCTLPPERTPWGGYKPAQTPVHRGLAAAMLRAAAKTATVRAEKTLQAKHEDWIATHESGATVYEVWARTHAYGIEGPQSWRIAELEDEESAKALAQKLAHEHYVEHGADWATRRAYVAERVERFTYEKRAWL